MGAVERPAHVDPIQGRSFTLQHQDIVLGEHGGVLAIEDVGICTCLFSVIEHLVTRRKFGTADLLLELGNVDGLVELGVIAIAANRALTVVRLQIIWQGDAGRLP